MWTEAELTAARIRIHQADQGIGIFTLEKYTRAMDQLDDYMIEVEKKMDWKPWGKRSIKQDTGKSGDQDIRDDGRFNGR